VMLPSHKENSRLEEAKKICELYKAGRANELPHKEMELTTVVAEASRIVTLENGPEAFEFLLSAIKIGELVFAGIGGEPFTEIGNRICEVSPFKKTILCCLTNSSGGYIPTTQAYEEGGYEAKRTDPIYKQKSFPSTENVLGKLFCDTFYLQFSQACRKFLNSICSLASSLRKESSGCHCVA